MADTTSRFVFTDPVPPLDELGRVHLIAIGGAGMSAVAKLLRARGVEVSGSDMADTSALASVRGSGARVHVGHDPAHVAGADTVVVQSAVREDNVELAAARAAGIRALHRSQALASLMGNARRVAVAGANGKTTTTSMLVVALTAAGAALGAGDLFRRFCLSIRGTLLPPRADARRFPRRSRFGTSWRSPTRPIRRRSCSSPACAVEASLWPAFRLCRDPSAARAQTLHGRRRAAVVHPRSGGLCPASGRQRRGSGGPSSVSSESGLPGRPLRARHSNSLYISSRNWCVTVLTQT